MSITIREIPLLPSSQNLTINVGNTNYMLDIIWKSDTYIMNIKTGKGEPIINGIPLLTGLDLLEQFKYFGIVGEWVMLPVIPYEEAVYETLGFSSHFCVVQEV